MKTLKWFLLVFTCLIAGITLANTEQAIPSFSGTIVDTTKWLNQQEILALQSQVLEVRNATKAQIAVLIVDSVKPESIEQYSIRVAEAWKVGKKGEDTGVLIVVARSDRKLRIEVGYGLEGRLTDLDSGRIINEIVAPKFKENMPYDGLHAGIEAIKVVLVKEVPETKKKASGSAFNWEEINIPYFDQLNSAGKIVAVVLGFIGGILILGGVYGSEGGIVLSGILIPVVGGFVLGLLVNITQCLIVALAAFVVSIVIAFGISIGGALIGGLFGGGGASGDW